METTIQYHAEKRLFFFEHEDSTRLMNMIQIWNLGVSEDAMREAMLSPDKRINVKGSGHAV